MGKAANKTRIVISGRAWRKATEAILASPPTPILTGPLRLGQMTDTSEYLLEDVDEVSGRLADSSFVICHRHNVSIALLASSSYEQLVWLAVEQLDGHWKVSATVIERGKFIAVREILVAGTGMLVFSSRFRPNPKPLPAEEQERWSRTIGAVGRATFDRIGEAAILVIGVGRIGMQIAASLAALGVRRLCVMDDDTVELSSLDGIFLSPADVGRHKVIALAEYLSRYQPSLTVQAIPKRADYASLCAYASQRFDLIITSTDHDMPRLAASMFCRRLLICHLDVATSIQRTLERVTIQGDVLLLPPTEGCVRCVGGIENLRESTSSMFAHRLSMRERQKPLWSTQRVGSLVSINSITAGIAIQSIIDLFSPIPTFPHWTQLQWTSELGLSSRRVIVNRSPDCSICSTVLG